MLVRVIPALTAAIAFSACATAQTPQPAAPDWMAGCWTNADGDAREVWSADLSGLMFGYGIAFADGEVVFFEELRLEAQGEGYVYAAAPGGDAWTRFGETARGETAITFENAEHDYPQRIAYQRDGDALTATISLIDGENARSFEFTVCTD